MHHLLRLIAGIAAAALLGGGLVAAQVQRSASHRALAPVVASQSESPKSEDVRRGGELFTGTRRLANHGPACLSCHSVGTLPRISGATFAPDLTRAHRHLGGGRGLTGWLGAPPTPMMRATFQPAPLTSEEARALAAYLVEAETSAADTPARSHAAKTLRGGAREDLR
jgi:mono/diheme cytochrome c family protein